MSANPANRLAPMPGPKRRRAAATVLAVAALSLGLGACGGSDEDVQIPPENADALLQTLSDIRAKVEAGDCTSATTDASQFIEGINALPKDVGADTKEELREAGENLQAMTQDPSECQDSDDEEEAPEPEVGPSGVEGEQG
jgi:hypothetical protein